MKKLIKLNIFRHVVRILLALCVALVMNYYLAQTKSGWLPCVTVLVMLTTTGSALYQGLLRLFLITVVVVVGSLIFSPMSVLYMRMYDVVLGAIIGILVNILVLPDKVDVEYRNAFIPVLKSYADYFSALVSMLLDGDDAAAEKEKMMVERNLQALPGWIYEAGFDLGLQKGYRYFLMRVGQIGEILFAVHHLARHSFSAELLDVIREPLLQCVVRVEQFVVAINTVLELRKLSEGIVDFGPELAEIEDRFKALVPTAVAATPMETEYAYLTEFIYDLRDMRQALLKLAEALR